MSWAALLLADRSPALRLRVLRELMGRDSDDPEVRELAALLPSDAVISELRGSQDDSGSWRPGAVVGSTRTGVMGATCLALLRLGYMGVSKGDAVVDAAASFVFGRQRKDGAWPMPRAREAASEREGYSMVPLQTAMPLRAIAACGYATDPRAERAYEWLLAQRLPDGSWPTGKAAGTLGRVAGYRRLSHSRWGCRSNTTGTLACFALHPDRRRSPEAARALDLLLGRDTHERQALGFEVARTVGYEPARGFMTHFARFDAAQVLDLCRRIGATRDDPRVADLCEHVENARGTYGLWEYIPRPEATRWVSFEILRTLAGLDESGEWLSLEPPTPFQAYPRRTKRF